MRSVNPAEVFARAGFGRSARSPADHQRAPVIGAAELVGVLLVKLELGDQDHRELAISEPAVATWCTRSSWSSRRSTAASPDEVVIAPLEQRARTAASSASRRQRSAATGHVGRRWTTETIAGTRDDKQHDVVEDGAADEPRESAKP
jgi:hypothetical protein